MRVLTLLVVALAGCFGPNVADGSLQCEIGDECPPGMFCRPDCGRRCYFSPSGTCGADAAVPVDTPPPPPSDAPVVSIPDVPVIPMPDAPVIPMPDAPVVTMPDAPVVTVPDAPVVTVPDAPGMTADACMMISAVDDAGIAICTTVKKP